MGSAHTFVTLTDWLTTFSSLKSICVWFFFRVAEHVVRNLSHFSFFKFSCNFSTTCSRQLWLRLMDIKSDFSISRTWSNRFFFSCERLCFSFTCFKRKRWVFLQFTQGDDSDENRYSSFCDKIEKACVWRKRRFYIKNVWDVWETLRHKRWLMVNLVNFFKNSPLLSFANILTDFFL